jgi:hypothetical protein
MQRVHQRPVRFESPNYCAAFSPVKLTACPTYSLPYTQPLFLRTGHSPVKTAPTLQRSPYISAYKTVCPRNQSMPFSLNYRFIFTELTGCCNHYRSTSDT